MSLHGESCVHHELGGEYKFAFQHNNFEVPLSLLNGEVELALVYRSGDQDVLFYYYIICSLQDFKN